MEYEIRSQDTETDGGEWPVERTVVKGWLRNESVRRNVGGDELVRRGWLTLCDNNVTVFPKYIVRDGEQVAKLRDPTGMRHIATGDNICMVYDGVSKILLTYSTVGKPGALLLSSSSFDGTVVGMSILNNSLHIATASGTQTASTLTLAILPIIKGLPVLSSMATQRVTLKGIPKVIFSTYQEKDRCLVLLNEPRIACFNAWGTAVAIVAKNTLSVLTVEGGSQKGREAGMFIDSSYYPGNADVHLVALGYKAEVEGISDVAWVKRSCNGWYIVVASSKAVTLVDPWSRGVVFKYALGEGTFALLPKSYQAEERGIQLGVVDTSQASMVVSLHSIGPRDYKLAISDALEAGDIEKATSVAAQSGLSNDVVWELGWANSDKKEADVNKYFPKLSAPAQGHRGGGRHLPPPHQVEVQVR
eukprot:TRINITY_DN5693_c0_g1_i1.p1 TRINITY_DN5693_c0_g1~~TRINITY_DN5693_c0_g1_i1.p1  ORF type:complete len:427 (+),score=91.79 TRINITY_DN5693_c0_g1_i1:32-1282(+)